MRRREKKAVRLDLIISREVIMQQNEGLANSKAQVAALEGEVTELNARVRRQMGTIVELQRDAEIQNARTDKLIVELENEKAWTKIYLTTRDNLKEQVERLEARAAVHATEAEQWSLKAMALAAAGDEVRVLKSDLSDLRQAQSTLVRALMLALDKAGA